MNSFWFSSDSHFLVPESKTKTKINKTKIKNSKQQRTKRGSETETVVFLHRRCGMTEEKLPWLFLVPVVLSYNHGFIRRAGETGEGRQGAVRLAPCSGDRCWAQRSRLHTLHTGNDPFLCSKGARRVYGLVEICKEICQEICHPLKRIWNWTVFPCKRVPTSQIKSVSQ